MNEFRTLPFQAHLHPLPIAPLPVHTYMHGWQRHSSSSEFDFGWKILRLFLYKIVHSCRECFLVVSWVVITLNPVKKKKHYSDQSSEINYLHTCNYTQPRLNITAMSNHYRNNEGDTFCVPEIKVWSKMVLLTQQDNQYCVFCEAAGLT